VKPKVVKRLAMAGVAVTVGASAIVISQLGASAASAWPTVAQGGKGANVTAIQYLLHAHGVSVGIDGDFGPQTASAVRSFQSSAHIGVDAQVGPQTWGKLIVQVQRGSKGDAVKAAQTLLNKNGAGLSVDGDFGGGTDTATRNFQRSAGLGVDGVVGPNTWRELAARSGGGGGGGGTGSYRYVLPHNAVARGELDDPHHDYPAVDIPAASGTPTYAVTSGTVHYVGGDCGLGIRLDAVDGAQYTYCHASARVVGDGAHVSPGQQLTRVGSTGNSTGPHLHYQIRFNGSLRCPGPQLLALYDGRTPPSPGSLPTSGCSHS
jgi:peptidoglycan hydrolase-like protein with peptidoglycan-binding domain